MPWCKSTRATAPSPVSVLYLFSVLIFLVALPPTQCALQNVTCDDQLGCDLPAGIQPATIEYIGGWSQGQLCPGCKIQPDPSLVSNGTWSDTTLDKGVNGSKTFNITFQGE